MIPGFLARYKYFLIMLVSISRAAFVLGVCAKTLRRWDKNGKVCPSRTSGNHRRYDLDAIYEFLIDGIYNPRQNHKTGCAAVYTRVSSNSRKKDLFTQTKYLIEQAEKEYPLVKIYTDIGSGLNDKRPNLLRLIRDALKKRFDCIYITYLDRLARFGRNPRCK